MINRLLLETSKVSALSSFHYLNALLNCIREKYKSRLLFLSSSKLAIIDSIPPKIEKLYEMLSEIFSPQTSCEIKGLIPSITLVNALIKLLTTRCKPENHAMTSSSMLLCFLANKLDGEIPIDYLDFILKNQNRLINEFDEDNDNFIKYTKALSSLCGEKKITSVLESNHLLLLIKRLNFIKNHEQHTECFNAILTIIKYGILDTSIIETLLKQLATEIKIARLDSENTMPINYIGELSKQLDSFLPNSKQENEPKQQNNSSPEEMKKHKARKIKIREDIPFFRSSSDIFKFNHVFKPSDDELHFRVNLYQATDLTSSIEEKNPDDIPADQRLLDLQMIESGLPSIFGHY